MYDGGGVKVTAFVNDHGPFVVPSYGYKIEYDDHSVVLCGDTRYYAEVVRQSTGVDVLVHCVTVIPNELLQKFPAYKAIYEHLASLEDAGRVFAEARPKLAVHSHIGLNGDSTQYDLVARTRKVYDGPLQVGRDLMTIEITGKPTVSMPK